MTESGYKLWKAIDARIPNIWEKLSSSSKKYHKKADGSVPTIAEHTYHMLHAASKVMKMFNYDPQSTGADTLLMSIVFHDGLKYGLKGKNPHTSRTHDKDAADMVEANKKTFMQVISESEVNDMVDIIRFHSGQWSTDTKIKDFSFSDRTPLAMFVHTLDMLSTSDSIQTDVRE